MLNIRKGKIMAKNDQHDLSFLIYIKKTNDQILNISNSEWVKTCQNIVSLLNLKKNSHTSIRTLRRLWFFKILPQLRCVCVVLNC